MEEEMEKRNLRKVSVGISTLCTGSFISISLAAAANASKCFIWNLL